MIKARFARRKGLLAGFTVSGHAGFAESGRDIVCASVSSAVQMASNTITEILGIKAEIRKGRAVVSLSLPTDTENRAAAAVLEGLELHLKLLSEQFAGFIDVEEAEV